MIPRDSQQMEGNQGRFSWIWILLVSVLFFYLIQSFMSERSLQQLSYTDFKEAVKNHRVAEVTFQGNHIVGRFREPKKPTSKKAKGQETPQAGAKQAQNSFVTEKPALQDPDLLPALEANNVIIRAKAKSNNWIGLFLITVLPWALIIGLMVYSARRMRQNMGGGPGQIFNFMRSKPKRITHEEVGVGYDDVAGLENAKRELREIVLYLKEPARFEQVGAELPKGILLIGPPGVGKTLMARATAGEADASFYSISGSEFIEMFVGVGASRVRNLFQQAKVNAPSIVFIDELDSIGQVRGTGIGGGNDEREQTLNQILNEMDGFSPRQAVIVLAATNRPDVLDPALTRPGRFDRRIVLDLPRKAARREILKTHARHVPMSMEVDLENIAERTVGMSGADLKNLINEAALLAARSNKRQVGPSELETARDKILMGIEREDVISDKERNVVAHHEAGHALVAKLLPDTDPLQKVSIIPRGQSLGATEQMPAEERGNLSRSYLLARLAVLLGGRVAEKLKFGEVSTGGGNDLKRATQLVRRMICEWGMSEELGPMTFGGTEPHPFLGRKLTEPKEFSEQTARLIDEQVRDILKGQETVAEQILKSHQEQLEALSSALLEHEVVTNEEVEQILDPGLVAIEN